MPRMQLNLIQLKKALRLSNIKSVFLYKDTDNNDIDNIFAIVVTDVDECKEFGKCSQICENMEDGYKCRCVAGYRLESKDRRTCKAIGL